MKKNQLNQLDDLNRTSDDMSDSNVRFSDFESDMFIKRLKSVISTEPLTSFAKRCGFSEATLRKYLNGAIPGIDKIAAIAKQNGLNIDWLLTGETPQYKHSLRNTMEYASVDPTEVIYNFTGIDMTKKDGKDVSKEQIFSQAAANCDYVLIDAFPEVRAAAGTGQVSPTDQTVVQLKVNSADWRRYVGLDHKHVKIITVHGDSMKPTLSHGDQVMVDTACSNFIDDTIYCIQQGDNLRFKRIKLQLDGKVIVKSDNEIEGFPPEIYTAEEAANFHVIGRVIPLKFGWFEI